jgi:drug/metabolite transporter (DMT)-like permease
LVVRRPALTPLVIALGLFAAAVHASWNAILRSRGDRLWAVTIMSYATTAVALPLAILAPLPSFGCWPLLAVSAVLQVAYIVLLAYAYGSGDLGQVYPIIRGAVPPIVALASFVFVGQRLSAALLGGVAIISAGIGLIALGRGRPSATSVGLALSAGAVIAAYVTVDSQGVRAAGNALTYEAWVFIAYGVLTPLTYRLMRGRFAAGLNTRDGMTAAAGGVLSMLSYGAVLAALAAGPAAPIAALRELSIVFSVLLGRFALGETLKPSRIIACVMVTAGVIVIGLAG